VTSEWKSAIGCSTGRRRLLQPAPPVGRAPGKPALGAALAAPVDRDRARAAPAVGPPPVPAGGRRLQAFYAESPAWLHAVYMHADNNLELAAICDLHELQQLHPHVAAGRIHVVVQLDRASGEDVEEAYDGSIHSKFRDGDRYCHGASGSPARLYKEDGSPANAKFHGAYRLELRPPEGLGYDGPAGKRSNPYWVVRADLGEINMDAQASVQGFVAWVLEHYPADRRFLELWDHGVGILGFGGDKHYQSNVDSGHWLQSLPSVVAGVRAGMQAAGVSSLDIMGFDACLMASVGVAEHFHGLADYLLASEELEPGHGWDHTTIDPAAATPKAYATAIIDGFIAYSNELPKTLALTQLSALPAFEAAAAALADTMAAAYERGATAALVPLARARDTTLCWKGGFGVPDEASEDGSPNPNYDPAYSKGITCDLGHFLTLFHEELESSGGCPGLSSQVSAALAAYTAMVEYERHAPNGPQSFTGKGIYFPKPAIQGTLKYPFAIGGGKVDTTFDLAPGGHTLNLWDTSFDGWHSGSYEIFGEGGPGDSLTGQVMVTPEMTPAPTGKGCKKIHTWYECSDRSAFTLPAASVTFDVPDCERSTCSVTVRIRIVQYGNEIQWNIDAQTSMGGGQGGAYSDYQAEYVGMEEAWATVLAPFALGPGRPRAVKRPLRFPM
jgi:hypothetical protein